MADIRPEFVFASEREAAGKLQDAARAAGVKLYPLPFSRFDPEKTTWWLSPVTDNPAYAFGKLVVENPTIVDDGAKLVGLHMEKGVGETAEEFFQVGARDRNQIMDRTWTWHPFLRALRSGALDESMRDAAAAAQGLPVVLELVAAPTLPRGGESDQHPLDPVVADRIRYRWSDDTLVRLKARTPTKLREFGEQETLTSVGEKIAQIEALDWTWVEVLVGVPFRPVASGGLASNEVWSRVCQPWLSWIR
jgi:hypothetical protein